MKKYIRPIINFEKIEENNLLTASQREEYHDDGEQCDCFVHREYGGCQGCKGGCGCSHWDGEKIVPGC